MRNQVAILILLALLGTTVFGQTVTGAPGKWDPICFEFSFGMMQSGPGAPLTMVDSCGTPGNYYVNLVTLSATNFPNGPLFGLDMTIIQALDEIAFGAPFFGVLDQDGTATFTIPPPLPAGLAVYFVAIEISYVDVTLVNVTSPFGYKVQ